MSSPISVPPSFSRGRNWRWWVCGLLLLATMINYMDRLVLNQSASRIMEDVGFDERGYGQLEGYFGAAFAAGGLSLGFVVDRFGPRVVYPAVVLLWSLAGFTTGFIRTFEELFACRVALGFFEAANWSCALKTTQTILRPEERTMGNGILQSGAALGAIITPLLVLLFLSWGVHGGWRPAFWVVGGLGLFWVILWLVVVRSGDLESFAPANRIVLHPAEGVQPARQVAEQAPAPGNTSTGAALMSILSDRRFWVLAFTVVAINLTWHFFRAWMPLFLERKHGYSPAFVQWFTMAYYLATDAGSLLSGYVALRLARGSLSVHTSRLLVFGACALVTLLSIPVAYLPAGVSGDARGFLLLGLLLFLGFAALGLFPNYYSFSQELTSQHQGKLSGMLTFACWIAMYPMQINVGAYVKETQSYTEAVALAGLPPLAALVVLLLFWKSAPRPAVAPAAPPEVAPALAAEGDARVTTDRRAVKPARE